MRRLVASMTAVVAVGAAGCLGAGVASADDSPPGWTADRGAPAPAPAPPPALVATPGHPIPPSEVQGRGYALGGAHVSGIPYEEYILRTGKDWFPGVKPKQIVNYPAGQVQGHTLERFFPGIGAFGESLLPGIGLDGPSIGESVDIGAADTIRDIKAGGPGHVMGLSEGAMVLNEVQARLANDPDAPPRDKLSFSMYGDPTGKHAFGEGFLTQNFPVGAIVPSLDYRIPEPVESQYDTYEFVSAYDSIADWPDRPDANWMSVINALAGLATGHTAVAFTKPENVPARNIRMTTNSKGANTTTYFIPEKHLPLVLPFKYLGVDEGTLNRLDGVLKPMVDAGYSRNDDPATAPITVDPVNGFDPAEVTAPASNAAFGGGADPVSQLLSGFQYMLDNGFKEPAPPAAPPPPPAP